MCKTTNSLYFTDNLGLPIAISSPVSGNHHDLYEIEERLDELFTTLRKASINTDGLFTNADAGFDSKKFRDKCSEYGIIANTALKPRNGGENQEILFDDELYEKRYTIERTNAWLDSYRTLLNRFETTVACWKSLNYKAFMIILFKNISKNKKS